MTVCISCPERAVNITTNDTSDTCIAFCLSSVQEAAYWWSWSVTHWLTLAASGLLCGLVGLYPFRHSSFALMLAFYWLFSAALISFSYFLSTLFSASRVAGTATQFIYALSMIPGWVALWLACTVHRAKATSPQHSAHTDFTPSLWRTDMYVWMCLSVCPWPPHTLHAMQVAASHLSQSWCEELNMLVRR